MKKAIMYSLAITTLAFGSCSTEESSPQGKTPITIKITDAPANYDAIFLNIDAIEIRTTGGKEVIDVEDIPFDILQYRFGRDTVLANHDVPSGRLQEIRLILEDEGNEIVVDGIRHPLITPSGQSSGVKIKIQDDLLPDIAYTLLLDFDASRSINQTGNGKYMLKPVLRAIPVAVSGAIKGIITPATAWPHIYAINGVDTVGTLSDERGQFYFPGMPEATYKIVIEPTVGDYGIKTVENVEVISGAVKDLNTIVLE